MPADRHGGRLPPPERRRVRAVRGLRRLLRRDPQRGADVPGIGCRGRRRRQLRGPGRCLPPSQVRQVYLVVRGDSLYKDMSSYLARRIEDTPDIEVLLNTEVRRMFGDNFLSLSSSSTRRRGRCGRSRPRRCSASSGRSRGPNGSPRRSRRTPRASSDGAGPDGVPCIGGARQPFLLETSRPGVFAAGDVRSGSIKRVASAVGEGSMAVQFVHEFLKCSGILITTDENASYSPTLERTTPSPADPCRQVWRKTGVSRYQTPSAVRCPSP